MPVECDGQCATCLRDNRFLRSPSQVQQIDSLLQQLATLTGNGEVHLVLQNGKYRFVQPVPSYEAVRA